VVRPFGLIRPTPEFPRGRRDSFISGRRPSGPVAGKLPPDLLRELVLDRTGAGDPAVLVGPSIGEDAAVVDLGGGRVLVAHADPITGAVEYIGRLAVHVVSNDVAARGVRPRWLLPVLQFPEGAGPDLIGGVTSQLDKAAREVGAAIVGGHSEVTPGLARTMISMTAIGIGERGKYVTTSGARAGDLVLMTKSAAIEGTAILSTDFGGALLEAGVPRDVIERGRGFMDMISILREGVALGEAGLATSMHDPTEGGLIGGLAEVAYASGSTLEVWEDEVPVAEETRIIAGALGLDPLRLIGSGALIATVPRDRADGALGLLGGLGIGASVIGRVGEYSGHRLVVHRRGGATEVVDDVYVRDELNGVWERYGERRPPGAVR